MINVQTDLFENPHSPSFMLCIAATRLNLAPLQKRIGVYNLRGRLEADHGKPQRLIIPVRGFQSMKTAYATFKGFEIMRMFKKGRFNIWMYGTCPEVSFINEQFGLYS